MTHTSYCSFICVGGLFHCLVTVSSQIRTDVIFTTINMKGDGNCLLHAQTQRYRQNTRSSDLPVASPFSHPNFVHAFHPPHFNLSSFPPH